MVGMVTRRVTVRPTAAPSVGIWTRRQRAVTVLAWALLGGLALWRALLGPWPAYLYQVAAAAGFYLIIRTGVVLRVALPVWAEYGFAFIDAAFVSTAVRLL